MDAVNNTYEMVDQYRQYSTHDSILVLYFHWYLQKLYVLFIIQCW